MKKKRVLLISCSVIMLCLCIIVGMSYALFTDSVSVGNHLQAGNLDVTLTRTGLKYSVLDENGELKEITVAEAVDFTEASTNNVFGIDSEGIRIVPGSYFDAQMKVKNSGNTAFNCSVGIKMLNDTEGLAGQLRVTVRDENGNVISTKMLSELTGGSEIDVGKVKVGEASRSFSVLVEFVNDADYTEGNISNNAAQNGSAVFDLIVKATQATTADSN